MYEEEFNLKFPYDKIEIPVYFMINKEGLINIDYKAMQKEFYNKLMEILKNVNPEVLK